MRTIGLDRVLVLALAACGDNLAGPLDAADPAIVDAGPPPHIRAAWVYGGSGSLTSFAAGNQIVVASIAAYPPGQQPTTAYVDRLDADGAPLWRRTLSGGVSYVAVADDGALIAPVNGALTFDGPGGLMVTGAHAHATVAAQLEPDGTVRWARAIASEPTVMVLYASVVDDTTRGAWLWRSGIAPNSSALVEIVAASGTTEVAHGVTGGRNVVHLGGDGTVFVATDNAIRGVRPDGTTAWSSPLAAAPRVAVQSLVPSADGFIATGATTATCPLGGPYCPSTPFVASHATDGTRRWTYEAFGPNVNVVALETVGAGARVLGSFVNQGSFDMGLPTQLTLEAPGTGVLYIANIAADGTLTDARTLGDIGCLTPRGAARVSGGWVVALERAPSVAAGCSEELVILDGLLTRRPGTSFSGWHVVALPDP